MASYDNTQEILPKLINAAVPNIWYPVDEKNDEEQSTEEPVVEKPTEEQPTVEPTT